MFESDRATSNLTGVVRDSSVGHTDTCRPPPHGISTPTTTREQHRNKAKVRQKSRKGEKSAHWSRFRNLIAVPSRPVTTVGGISTTGIACRNLKQIAKNYRDPEHMPTRTSWMATRICSASRCGELAFSPRQMQTDSFRIARHLGVIQRMCEHPLGSPPVCGLSRTNPAVQAGIASG